MRVLITQPVADAAAVAAALQGRGHHVFTTPVVIVERTAAPSVKLEGAQGFIVTSPDGARALAHTIGVRTFPVFADSATTASELARLGFKNVKAAKDDSTDLAKLVEKSANPNAGAFIYACSTSAPIQLGALLSNMGFAVRSLPLYSITRADRVPPEMRKVLEKGAVDAAVFLSADEARAFVTLIQRENLEPLVKDLKTIAANPVVAAPLRALKLGAVVVPPAGDLETIYNALDQKLVDKVEEERAEQERLKREQIEKEHAEQERLAAEKADQKRLEKEKAAQEKEARKQAKLEQEAREKFEREQAAKEKAERERLAAEQKQAEQDAERARLARLAKEEAVHAQQEKAEQEKLAAARRVTEDAERKRQDALRAEEERKTAEAQAQKRAAEDRAEQERINRERAEKEEQARLAAEHAQKQKTEDAHRAEEEAEANRLKALRAEEDRIAAEASETAAREQATKDQAEAERLAAEKAEQNRIAAEAAETAAREQAAKDQAEAKRRADEKAEQDRIAAEAAEQDRADREKAEHDRRAAKDAARKAAEAQRIERAQQKKSEKEAAKKRKQEAKAAARAAREKKSADASALSAPSGGLVGKFKAWRAGRNTPEPTGPMYTRFQGEPSAEPDMKAPDMKADVAHKTPSVTIAPPVAAAAPKPTPVSEPPPQPEEKQDVSQEPPQSSPDEAPLPKESSPTPPPSTMRGGGRAERLRAEDAADQKAGQHRYKNFDIGESSAEPASSASDQGTAFQAAGSKASGGIGRVVSLFILLVVVATAIIGTASWWVPRVTQLVRGIDAPGESAPAPSVQPVQTTAAPEAPDTNTPQSPAPSTPMDALQSRLETLERTMAGGGNNAATAAATADLNKRLQALEQGGRADDASVTSISESVSSQARQLAAVSARLATLEAAIGNAARVEDLNSRLTVLEGKSADAASVLALSDRVTILEDTSRRAVAEQTAEVALLMATAQLREAIAEGRSFAMELETANALSARVLGAALNDDGFAVYGARGIPSLNTLQRRFDATAAQVVRAAAIPDGATGWLRQSLDRLMAIVTVRRVGGDIAGDGTSAVLARAESRLTSGDLNGAAIEMTALTGASAEAAAPWLADVRARIAADRAITATLSRTMALMTVDERTQTPAATAPATSAPTAAPTSTGESE